MKKIITALICLFLLPVYSVAQDEAPPSLSDSWMVVPKPGHEAEFEAAFKAHVAMRDEKGDPRRWQVYTPVVGDRIDYHVVRHCCFDWADQDAYSAWSLESGLGQHWNETVHPHVASYQHHLSSTDWANSHWPEGTVANYVGVTTWVVKQGSGAGMTQSVTELSSVAKEHDWPRNWVWGNRISGSASLYLASPHENYASMAPPEQNFYAFLAEHLDSEEKAREMLDRFSSHFESASYTIYRHNKELSLSYDEGE